MLSRRGMIGGLIAAVAAPAIVHAHDIMPVRLVTWDLGGVILPEGIKTFESYPWKMTIDYDKAGVISYLDKTVGVTRYGRSLSSGDYEEYKDIPRQVDGITVECLYEQELLKGDLICYRVEEYSMV